MSTHGNALKMDATDQDEEFNSFQNSLFSTQHIVGEERVS